MDLSAWLSIWPVLGSLELISWFLTVFRIAQEGNYGNSGQSSVTIPCLGKKDAKEAVGTRGSDE